MQPFSAVHGRTGHGATLHDLRRRAGGRRGDSCGLRRHRHRAGVGGRAGRLQDRAGTMAGGVAGPGAARREAPEGPRSQGPLPRRCPGCPRPVSPRGLLSRRRRLTRRVPGPHRPLGEPRLHCRAARACGLDSAAPAERRRPVASAARPRFAQTRRQAARPPRRRDLRARLDRHARTARRRLEGHRWRGTHRSRSDRHGRPFGGRADDTDGRRSEGAWRRSRRASRGAQRRRSAHRRGYPDLRAGHDEPDVHRSVLE